MLRTVAAAALERVPALAALSAPARARALGCLRHQARAPGSKLFEAEIGGGGDDGGGAGDDAEQSLYVVGAGGVVVLSRVVCTGYSMIKQA